MKMETGKAMRNMMHCFIGFIYDIYKKNKTIIIGIMLISVSVIIVYIIKL